MAKEDPSVNALGEAALFKPVAGETSLQNDTIEYTSLTIVCHCSR